RGGDLRRSAPSPRSTTIRCSASKGCRRTACIPPHSRERREPGLIDTPGLNNLMASAGAGEQRMKAGASGVPLGRLGTPDEIAAAPDSFQRQRLALFPPDRVTEPVQAQGQARGQLGLELDLGRRDRLAAGRAVGAGAAAGPGLVGLVAGHLAGLHEPAKAKTESDRFPATSLS